MCLSETWCDTCEYITADVCEHACVLREGGDEGLAYNQSQLTWNIFTFLSAATGHMMQMC